MPQIKSKFFLKKYNLSYLYIKYYSIKFYIIYFYIKKIFIISLNYYLYIFYGDGDEGKNTIERYQQLFVAYDNAPESFHDAFQI